MLLLNTCSITVLIGRSRDAFVSSPEIVRAMTYVINQGMAMYWGTSRWTAMEIMVSWW